MDIGERGLESAERNEREMARRGVAKIREKLAGDGEDNCIACGDPIDIDRRMAVPSARRCIECQRASERKHRG